MSLAFDEVEIELAGEVVHLRPTLRAAMRLEKRYGGFSDLIVSIGEGNLTTIAEVISQTSAEITDVPTFLETIKHRPVGAEINRIINPLTQLAMKMAGLDEAPVKRTNESNDSECITFAEYFETLFGNACGVLGWTPDTAWNATPAEINAAYRARVELLHALFGTGTSNASEKGKETSRPLEHTPDQIKSGIAQLHALSLSGANKAA